MRKRLSAVEQNFGDGHAVKSAPKTKKLISGADIILLAAILLIAGALLWVFRRNTKTGMQVRLAVDGEVVQILSLDTDMEYEVKTERGSNLVVIKNGTAAVTEADCPDKICVNHNPISKSGETIICLPHRLVVEIVE